MLTRDEVLNEGFSEITHLTLMNVLFYKLGRRRYLSFGCIGVPNEIMSICEVVDENNPKLIRDLVILHDFDYDGYMTLEKLRTIIKGLTMTNKK